MSSLNFDTTIATYDLALTALEKSEEPRAEEVLAVLTGRDRVQSAIDSADSTASLIQLIHLDNRLRKLRDVVLKAVRSPIVVGWVEVRNPTSISIAAQ